MYGTRSRLRSKTARAVAATSVAGVAAVAPIGTAQVQAAGWYESQGGGTFSARYCPSFPGICQIYQRTYDVVGAVNQSLTPPASLNFHRDRWRVTIHNVGVSSIFGGCIYPVNFRATHQIDNQPPYVQHVQYVVWPQYYDNNHSQGSWYTVPYNEFNVVNARNVLYYDVIHQGVFDCRIVVGSPYGIFQYKP